MKDRYLYRAKRKNWRELPKEMWWVQGYYAFIDNHHYIYTGNLCNGGLYVVAERFEIDIATLCACTGLEDKNGKLIWENDVVTGWFDDKIINGYIMYGSNATFFIERKGLYGIHLDNSEDWLEVIGNIFDEGSENNGKGAEEN